MMTINKKRLSFLLLLTLSLAQVSSMQPAESKKRCFGKIVIRPILFGAVIGACISATMIYLAETTFSKESAPFSRENDFQIPSWGKTKHIFKALFHAAAAKIMD